MRMSREIDEIASLTAEIESTFHVGRRNRLMTRQGHVFDAIDASAERLELLRALLAHSDPSVRLAAARRCGWGRVLLEGAERAMTEVAKRPDGIGREAREWLERLPRMASEPPWRPPPPKTQSYDPTPAGCSNEAAAELIERLLPGERAGALLPLLLRVIRAWPGPRTDDPRASCFGGAPVLPPGHAWPSFEDEPLLFLGQINFAEVHAAIGPNPLPERGLVQFYGDHDEVNGGGPMDSGLVLSFPDPGALQPAPTPVPDFLELPRCGLSFYETVELPDPLSDTIVGMRLGPDEARKYAELREKLMALSGNGGICDRFPSKLFGWPDLMRDLGADCGAPDAGRSLLLQIGWYHDGARWQDWGPGGLVYFILGQREIEKARFDLAAMEMQCS
jgi:hypothetical protein